MSAARSASNNEVAVSAGPRRQRKPVYLISIFEFAERFSYFGMLAILVYYLYFSATDGGLALDQVSAVGLVGAYGGGVYLATIIGGWVADRLLGAARTLLVGACLILCGHVALALIPGLAGVAVGLILVAIGSGFTKPTCATLIGSLYSPGDPKRIVGFTIFYLALNLGAFIGGVAVGFVQQTWGFHMGFGLAAIGMLVGLLLFWPAWNNMPSSMKRPPTPADRKKLTQALIAALLAIGAVGLLFLLRVASMQNLPNVIAAIGLVLVVAYFVAMRRSTQVTPTEFSTAMRYLPIFLASVVHVGLWMQLYTSVSMYAEANSDRLLWGIEIPAASVISSGALSAIILTPVLNAIWKRLGSKQPSTAGKYVLSLLSLSICFVAMGMSALAEGAVVPVSLVLGIVAGFYVADLIAGPAGLAYASATAPRAFEAQMISIHSLSFAIGASLSGSIASLYDPATDRGTFFFGVAGFGVIMATGVFLFRNAAIDGKRLNERVMEPQNPSTHDNPT